MNIPNIDFAQGQKTAIGIAIMLLPTMIRFTGLDLPEGDITSLIKQICEFGGGALSLYGLFWKIVRGVKELIDRNVVKKLSIFVLAIGSFFPFLGADAKMKECWVGGHIAEQTNVGCRYKQPSKGQAPLGLRGVEYKMVTKKNTNEFPDRRFPKRIRWMKALNLPSFSNDDIR